MVRLRRGWARAILGSSSRPSNGLHHQHYHALQGEALSQWLDRLDASAVKYPRVLISLLNLDPFDGVLRFDSNSFLAPPVISQEKGQGNIPKERVQKGGDLGNRSYYYRYEEGADNTISSKPGTLGDWLV